MVDYSLPNVKTIYQVFSQRLFKEDAPLTHKWLIYADLPILRWEVALSRKMWLEENQEHRGEQKNVEKVHFKRYSELHYDDTS